MADYLAQADTGYAAGTIVVEGQQWIRKAQLVFGQKGLTANSTGMTLDTSELHFRFNVNATQLEAPNTMSVRVYNLSAETANRLIKEFDKVTLSAGYEHSHFGIIFGGSVRQWRKGREGITDTFLELFAATNDVGYNFGFINRNFGEGATWTDAYREVCHAFGVARDKPSEDLIDAAKKGVQFTQSAYYNLGRALARQLAGTVGATWSVQVINGVETLVLIPYQGIRPGRALVLDAKSGLIGTPEAQEDGIHVRLLLNPTLAVGASVLISADLINQVYTDPQTMLMRPRLQASAPAAANGLYRILSVDHVGDTRGQEWYTEIVCFGLDKDVVVADPNLVVDESRQAPVGGARR